MEISARGLASVFACISVACCAPMATQEVVLTPASLQQSRICFGPMTRSSGGTQLALRTMNNDGGWCWMNWSYHGYDRSYGPSMSVTSPPLHGKLDIVRGKDTTRIAYKPDPGFFGEDHYALLQVEANVEQPFSVTVGRFPSAAASKGQQLIDLKTALDRGGISQSEYDAQRTKVLEGT